MSTTQQPTKDNPHTGIDHNFRHAIAVDYDGVLHAFSKGWHTGDIYDPPMPGAAEALVKLSKRYSVFILTARPAREVLDWCFIHFPDSQFCLVPDDVKFWDSPYIGVTNRKLPALAYIDDRAVRFTNWQDMKNYFL